MDLATKLIDALLYAIPALITGLVAYYFFKEHTKNEDGRRRFLLQKDMQVNTMPLRLQAYERMAIFLERISPAKLLIRVTPISSNKEDYESLLIANVEQEFEHNLSQQIYLSSGAWELVKTSKEEIIQLVNISSSKVPSDANSSELAMLILNITANLGKKLPNDVAIDYIKKEITQIF